MSNDKSTNKNQPTYSQSYEENPDDKVALQKAIENLPVKDYSDYEITIESKAHYEDALFQDDESFVQATTQSAVDTTTTKPASNSDSDIAALSTEPSENQTNHRKIDYQRFLRSSKQSKEFASKPAHLAIQGINQSMPNTVCPTEEIIIAPAVISTPANDNLALLQRAPQPSAAEPSTPDSSTKAVNDSSQSIVNTLFKKIQAKAAEKISEGKEQVDEYLGRTLPIRELPLNFQIPKLKAAKDFDELYSESKMAELLQAKKIKNPILSRCEQALANVLKADLSGQKKAAVFAAAEQAIADRSRSLVSSLERKPCLGDDPSRAEAINLCLQNIRHLINGYKQLYAQLYEASNLIYGPQRDKANQYAFKLVDFLCLEQRLCIACHQMIVEVNHRTFNNLYLGLAMYEPEQLSLSQQAYCLGSHASIKTLFTQYQLLSALQTQQLSASFHKTMKDYLLEHQAFINILPLNHDKRLEQASWCIDHNANSAVLVEHLRVKGERDWPCVYIQLQGLLSTIKSDYCHVLKQLSGQVPSGSLSTTLAALNPRQKLVVLSMLNDSVGRIESATHPAQFSRYEIDTSQVYSNIDNAVALLHFESYQQQTVKSKQDHKPEKPIAAQSRWSVAHEDEHAVYLQAHELKSKLALDIGDVLLLSKTVSNDEQSHIINRIGHIFRLYRDHSGNVFIHLYKYGDDCAAIKIHSKQNSIDAIISAGTYGNYLLLEKSPYLKAGTTLAVSFDNEFKTTIMVDQLITVTPQCYAYRLH